MPDSKKYLHPEAIRRIARLEVRARQIVEGFLSGSHRSPYFGQSVEFLQHREYTSGDDLRYIDWQVWARQDRFYIKQYEEDTNLRCHLLVDVSNSMKYGFGLYNKYDYGCTIAACLAWLVGKQQDAVGLATFDEQVLQRVPVSSRRNHILKIAQALQETTFQPKTDVTSVFRKVAQTFPKRGITVVISDLLTDAKATLDGLRLLRQQGHDVLVFHVMDDDELDFEFDGPTQFEGLETEATLACNPRALREGYLRELDQFLKELKIGCAKQSVDYALVRTSDPFGMVLSRYLNRRLGMHQRNRA